VKLFSHGVDPDGLGSVVLANLVYRNLDFTLCKSVSFHSLKGYDCSWIWWGRPCKSCFCSVNFRKWINGNVKKQSVKK